MACFTAVIPEVVALHFVKKHIEKKEAQNLANADFTNVDSAKFSLGAESSANPAKIPMSVKLSWLITMLWGGIFLLAIEHLWHGEIIASPPFLSAIATGEVASMMEEIILIGGAIDIFIPAVWFVACMAIEKMRAKSQNLALGA